MKKSRLIVLLLVFSLINLSVNNSKAEGEIIVGFNDPIVEVGDTVEVNMWIEHNLTAAELTITYDTKYLEYSSINGGTVNLSPKIVEDGVLKIVDYYSSGFGYFYYTITFKALMAGYSEVRAIKAESTLVDEKRTDVTDSAEFYYAEVIVNPKKTEPATQEPTTTEVPTTQPPTTEEPSTEAPTTEPPTTQAPTTTAEPSTEAPTTTQRPPSSEARLSSLALVGGELSPAFSPNVFRYDLYVEHSTNALSVRYSPMDDHVQDAYYWPYVNAENGGIPVGDTEFTVRVIAEDGSSHDYVVMIHRAAPPTTAAPTTQPPATQPPTVPSTETPTEPPTEPTTEPTTTAEETTEPSSETDESTEDPSVPDESSEPVTDDSGEETTPAETTEEVPEGDVIYRSSQVELKVLPIPDDLELPAGYEITEFTNEAGVPYQALIPSEGAKRQHCIFYGALVERDGDTYRLHEEGLYLFDIIGNTLQRYGMAVTPSTEPTTEESTTEAPPASEPGSSPAESKTEPAGTTVAPGTKASTNAPSSAQPGTTAQIPSSTSSGGDSRQTPSAGIPWWLWLALLLLFALFILMLCLLLKARKELKEERTSNERLSPEEEDAFLAMNKGQLLEKARTANPPADPYAIDSVTVENLDDVIPAPGPEGTETEGTKE